ncbi:hypothetical protein GCM10009757_21340 [Streptomyces cheonanensis]|uniref:Uncharacterized protein n=1 Tax=Streptomyces cheonanensis TaxID=312720 RepID=A0ABN2V934_9ACTN
MRWVACSPDEHIYARSGRPVPRVRALPPPAGPRYDAAGERSDDSRTDDSRTDDPRF